PVSLRGSPNCPPGFPVSHPGPRLPFHVPGCPSRSLVVLIGLASAQPVPLLQAVSPIGTMGPASAVHVPGWPIWDPSWPDPASVRLLRSRWALPELRTGSLGTNRGRGTPRALAGDGRGAVELRRASYDRRRSPAAPPGARPGRPGFRPDAP